MIRQRYGNRGVKIIYMGSTHVIHLVIDWLYDLKINKSYNIYDLVRNFERVLDDWEKVTLFVNKEMDPEVIKSEILEISKLKHDFFFIFALGNDAVSHTQLVVAQLIKDNFFKNNYYLPHSSSPYIGDLPSYMCHAQYWKDFA